MKIWPLGWSARCERRARAQRSLRPAPQHRSRRHDVATPWPRLDSAKLFRAGGHRLVRPQSDRVPLAVAMSPEDKCKIRDLFAREVIGRPRHRAGGRSSRSPVAPDLHHGPIAKLRSLFGGQVARSRIAQDPWRWRFVGGGTPSATGQQGSVCDNTHRHSLGASPHEATCG